MEKCKIIFLHHSTGKCILRGNTSKLSYKLGMKGDVKRWFKKYNRRHKTKYIFEDLVYPKKEPYGWNNYPYDYYNIWVKNAGNVTYLEEPTLEILTKKYDIIIFKHCFPVSRIESSDNIIPYIDSDKKTIENYKLQYNAIKEKLIQYPNNKFILFTGAALVKKATNEEEATRAKDFFTWVKNEWDEKNDNIFIWDFYELETEGGIYLKPEYAKNEGDSHPNMYFAAKVVPFFCNRIINVIENKGDLTSVTGE